MKSEECDVRRSYCWTFCYSCRTIKYSKMTLIFSNIGPKCLFFDCFKYIFSVHLNIYSITLKKRI